MAAVIIWTIIIGLIIGALGRLLVPGRQNIGLLLTMLIGIIGAIVGYFIAKWLGVAHTHGINWIEHIIQVVVAAIGVALVSGGGRSRRRI
ncbi:MAG TPA: GlsB/YeaQ/YmgE family stress response membrane protein [Micromonosporaceae bacterium]|jgi:uncharacterized membrane protein YeaQ/YmgE (transglycosylase-associated protein family)